MSDESKIACLCLGPTGSGKTALLKKLSGNKDTDEYSSTVPTVGTSLTTIKIKEQQKIIIRELGGEMAPLWHQYYDGINKIIYVVDASNLCQISAAGVLLYDLLAQPKLQKAKILLVLAKMDVSYRQMRNEALLMLQIKRLEKEIPQTITILETSAVTGEGMEPMLEWLQSNVTVTFKEPSSS
ncbi:unnamed protein product [Bemisia tabaci]|uniref:ADP-ribosylation factor-like protein 16 n=1 Tax=Bemisia tabaci TaxID=7038 RepID=A0A9P0F4T5_BEMTA|nr:unnamed protein product [Bemisia tabaci]